MNLAAQTSLKMVLKVGKNRENHLGQHNAGGQHCASRRRRRVYSRIVESVHGKLGTGCGEHIIQRGGVGWRRPVAARLQRALSGVH